jgi:ribosomal protein S18 acetylase RimI-like enzyme
VSAALQLRGQRDFYRAITEATPGGRVVELGGTVEAFVCDLAPDVSIPNAVLYEDGAELRDALDDLADVYADAGVRAWTVWVRPGDAETAAALRAAGHRIDGEPALMSARLAAMDLAPRTELDLVAKPDLRTVGAINDAAWGLPAEAGYAALMEPIDASFARLWVARAGGRPAASVVTRTVDGHTTVWLVATHPDARGRGLCSELMRAALRSARDAGAETTALEGSPMGTPVYAALGYETHGRLALYERRVRR